MFEKIKCLKGKEIELEYLLTGEEHQETIVFIHGAGANLRQFMDQHQYFSKDYRVLSVSLRGHGKSGQPKVQNKEAYSLEKHRDDLLELFEHLKVQSFHYVGNSAGGLVGYELAAVRPQLFKSFITFGTTAELKFSKAVTNLIAGIDRFMLKMNAKGYCGFVSKNSSKYEATKPIIYDALMMCSKEGLPLFRKNLGNYSYISLLEEMEIPFMLIQGEWDHDINRSLKSTLGAIDKNKRAQIVKLSSAGHFANLDRPGEFNRIIEDFISKSQLL